MSQCPERLDLVVRRKNTGFELVAREAAFLFQLTRVRHELIGRANLSVAGFVAVSPETIRGKWNPITHFSAENRMDGHTPGLPHDVETGELQGREQLRSVVIERRCWIGDAKPHLFEAHRIVSEKIRFERANRG